VRFVRAIKEAQDLGFTLGEIEEHLRLTRRGSASDAIRPSGSSCSRREGSLARSGRPSWSCSGRSGPLSPRRSSRSAKPAGRRSGHQSRRRSRICSAATPRRCRSSPGASAPPRGASRCRGRPLSHRAGAPRAARRGPAHSTRALLRKPGSRGGALYGRRLGVETSRGARPADRARRRGRRPSTAPLGDSHTFAVTMLVLTDEGRKVLAGEADAITVAGIDRWLGGTYLRPGNVWRWDPADRRVRRS
jgi:DNA-binding transcriptional MerR regulator